MVKYTANLTVDGSHIAMNEFVESFLANTVVGAVHSLKGVDFMKRIQLKIDGSDVTIEVNGEDITLTAFPNKLIGNTVKGLLLSLKNVDTIRSLDISVDVR